MESPPVFEEHSSPLKDGQPPNVLENAPEEETKQSPNSPLSNGLLSDSAHGKEEILDINKMTSDLESTKLALLQITSRSKVLLVEDNTINLKVCSAPPNPSAEKETHGFTRSWPTK